jgi:hypothetical protein
MFLIKLFCSLFLESYILPSVTFILQFLNLLIYKFNFLSTDFIGELVLNYIDNVEVN